MPNSKNHWTSPRVADQFDGELADTRKEMVKYSKEPGLA